MLTQTIDTRHGTANQYHFSNGNCLPYTGVPFGMNYFAPQTTDQKRKLVVPSRRSYLPRLSINSSAKSLDG